MTEEELVALINQGEGMSLEFKRCGNGPENDVLESICSFANRQGGALLLGVLDDGTIEGIPKNRALDIERRVASSVNNPKLFSPSPSVEIERIEFEESRCVIKIWVPMGPSVYRLKGQVYDRIADADVRICSDVQITALGMRKQNYYTERQVYPWISAGDLRANLIERARKMAARNRSGHPWAMMSDTELLQSAHLVGRDSSTGQRGITRAAVMLLGSDDLIYEIAPAYCTEALLRRQDGIRYDDRLTVRTNLMEAYDELVGFCMKWLPDAFALDGTQRVSPRDVISRELVANTLVHREYSSPYVSTLEIGPNYISTRNASRSLYSGPITLDNFDPTPKNPSIANFFVQIGLAERLGSGTRSLYRYSALYGGGEPELCDGDFFTARLPVPDVASGSSPVGDEAAEMIRFLLQRPNSTSTEVAQALGVSPRTAARWLSDLANRGIVIRTGKTRGTKYCLAMAQDDGRG